MKRIIFAMLVMVLFFSNGSLLAFTIDGSYSDWGIDPANSHWIPWDSTSTNHGSLGNQERGSTIFNGKRIYYSLEDAVGTDNEGNSGYVEPGYGGQDYDAEGAYLYLTDEYLFLGIVTGYPESGISSHDTIPGDIAFLFTDHLPSDSEIISTDYQYGLTLNVNSRTGFVNHALYNASGWETGLSNWSGAGGVTLMTGGTLVSNDSSKILVEYGTVDSTIPRYFIEARLSRDLFGSDWGLGKYVTIHWAPSCANDHLEVTAPTPVPEPATLILMGMGLISLGTISRKRILS